MDCFRKVFRAASIKKARLYMTAYGLYEAAINGQRVGDFVRAPGITDYRKRIQYAGWDWLNDGPIRFADNKDGEVVYANNVPSYQGKAKVTNHPVTPAASNNVPVTEHERLKAKRITAPSGKTVLDFGQNIAGYAEFTVTAHIGQKIKLRFGELLDENGEFTQKNIQCSSKKITTPLQQVIYTCKEGKNHYKTTFAIFGFQYVLVETDVAFQSEDFAAIAVYSDMERTGFLKAPTHFSISLLKTPSGVPRTTTPTCPQIARPANATAGRATRRFSSTLRHIFLTMRLLHRNICGMCTTGRKKTGSCRKSPPTAVWISICPLWTEVSAGGCGRADSVSFLEALRG